MAKVTTGTLQKMRQEHDAITMLTCTDSSFAGLLDAAGIDIFLIGDSLGMVIQGHDSTLPVSMELDSKKVLPPGAVVLVMHGMEFANGNQVARDCAQGVLAALAPQDQMGVILWDGTERWIFPLAKVGDKAAFQSRLDAVLALLTTEALTDLGVKVAVEPEMQRTVFLFVCAYIGIWALGSIADSSGSMGSCGPVSTSTFQRMARPSSTTSMQRPRSRRSRRTTPR